MKPLQEPPEGCQEIPGVILIVEPGKSWLTATGEITGVWKERGVWASEEDANRFKDQLFGE